MFYQLNERVSFIDPEDPIVAVLLFELGNVAWITGAKYEANRIYEMAQRYGSKGDLFEKRYAYVKSHGANVAPLDYEANHEIKTITELKPKDRQVATSYLWLIVASVISIGTIVGVLIIKKKTGK